jgi:hypothetical protein
MVVITPRCRERSNVRGGEGEEVDLDVEARLLTLALASTSSLSLLGISSVLLEVCNL